MGADLNLLRGQYDHKGARVRQGQCARNLTPSQYNDLQLKGTTKHFQCKMDLSASELLSAIADINDKIRENLNENPSVFRDIKHRFLIVILNRTKQAYQNKIRQQLEESNKH